MATANLLQQTFLSFTTDTMYSFSSEHRKEGPHLQLLISIWHTRYSILHKADGQYEIVSFSASDPKPRDFATQWTCWLVDNQHRDPPLMLLYQRLFFSLLAGSPISHNLGGGGRGNLKLVPIHRGQRETDDTKIDHYIFQATVLETYKTNVGLSVAPQILNTQRDVFTGFKHICPLHCLAVHLSQKFALDWLLE